MVKTMNRNNAKTYAKSKLPDYLRNQGININKNFSCLNPSHPDKNPSMGYNKASQQVKCFSPVCGVTWDIFDLIGIIYGLTDEKEKFTKTYATLGITINQNDKEFSSLKANTHNQVAKIITQEQEEVPTDYTNFFKEACGNTSNEDFKNYMSSRGISEDTANKFGLGYVENWQSPTALKNNKKHPSSPRIIFPTSKTSYVARDTRNNLSHTQAGYKKMIVGKANLFNVEALNKTEPCFVTEGEFDALSFLELGYNAVSIGSSNNTRLFLTKLKGESISCPLVLAFDADKAGKKATIEMQEGLHQLGITFFTAEIYESSAENNIPKFTSQLYENYKDANEFLVSNKDSFELKIKEILNELDDEISIDAQAKVEEEEIAKQEYLQKSAFYHVEHFRNSISLKKDTVSTGFNNLDKVLDGGLSNSLYVIGAISSLGKTTFVIQIADYIAFQGQDVLFFSLEMSMYELMAKSISRHTAWYCEEFGFKDQKNLAKSAQGITSRKKYDYYTPQECDIIYNAGENYKKYADKLFLHEGSGQLGVKEIQKTVEEHKQHTGNTPIVIVDYLQILSPYNDRSTERQNIDKAVLELKRLSRNTPVLVVSSLNRESYKNPIIMQSFKESGSIEYSCDVLIGLQLKGVEGSNFDVDNAKQQDPRQVELKILKNRNGITGVTLDFSYHPKFNLFKELSTSVSCLK